MSPRARESPGIGWPHASGGVRIAEEGDGVSGPKGYEYSVRAAELDRQRAVTDAQARCMALWEQARDDAAEARAYGDETVQAADMPRIAAGASAAEARTTADAFAHRAGEVAKRRDAARAASIAHRFTAHLPQELKGRIEIRWDAAPVISAQVERIESGVSTSTSAEVETVATAVLEALVHVTSEESRESWRRRAVELATAGDIRVLKALSLEVHTGLREQRRRESLAAEAAEISLTLAGIHSPAAAAARAALAGAADRNALKAAAGLARGARDEHRVGEERRFVIEQTAAALAELGYEVDEEFHMTALAGGLTVLAKDGLADHGLQVRFSPDSARLLTNTVALAPSTSVSADVAAETETCADLVAVGSRLRDRGVSLEQFHAMDAGVVPIERRLEAEAVRRRRRARAHGHERERRR